MELKPKYKLFADTYLSTGDPIAAYQKAYPNATKNSARVKSYTLLQNVTISAYIKEISYKIEAEAQNKLVNKLSDREAYNLLTYQEKREILAKISRGEILIPVKKVVWDDEQRKFVNIEMMEVADHSARMKALDLDNKMTGHEAPKKIANTDKDGNDVRQIDLSKMTPDQLNVLLQAKKLLSE